MLAVEWGTGQVFLSILWFFVFVLWIWLVVSIFGDLIRSDDLSGWGKALWALFIIFIPLLGVLVYLIVRGTRMSDRAAADAEAQRAAVQDYVRQSAATMSVGEQLSQLEALHSAGQLDDQEYAAAKARVIG